MAHVRTITLRYLDEVLVSLQANMMSVDVSESKRVVI